MVLTKDQKILLESKKNEIDKIIKQLQQRKKNLSIRPTDLRGDRNQLMQKRRQMQRIEGAKRSLVNQRQQVNSLLREPKVSVDSPNLDRATVMSNRTLPKPMVPRRINLRRLKR